MGSRAPATRRIAANALRSGAHTVRTRSPAPVRAPLLARASRQVVRYTSGVRSAGPARRLTPLPPASVANRRQATRARHEPFSQGITAAIHQFAQRVPMHRAANRRLLDLRSARALGSTP